MAEKLTGKAEALRELASRSIADVEARMSKLEIRNSGEARVSAALFLTIAEQFQAALTLVDNRSSSHAAAPIRSMVESVVDLVNIAKNANYVNQLIFDNARTDATSLTRYLDAMGDGAIGPSADRFREVLQITEETRDRLKAAGFKRQTREDKFEMAGLVDLSASYGLFCMLVHPNITALTHRHAGNDNKFKYREPVHPETMSTLLSVAIRTLTEAVRHLPCFSNIDRAAAQTLLDDMRTACLNTSRIPRRGVRAVPRLMTMRRSSLEVRDFTACHPKPRLDSDRGFLLFAYMIPKPSTSTPSDRMPSN
ncbi:DUF5677 domain-containing protein [Paraburkholderia caribensis]|nr:DUF5677 domain-containing protein [Paraburkholderia caribensis]MCO4881557.1 DUF5677 domain-containing protein [Paraburkholderia caribensis]